MNLREDMTSLIIAAVIGLAVGVGGTIGIQQATKPKEEPKPLVVAVGGGVCHHDLENIAGVRH